MNSYVVLDLETTGLAPDRDRILEIGALKIEDDCLTDRCSMLINPEVQIPYTVQNLTGITQAMAETGEKPEKALKDFLDFCGNLPLLGHNILFDYSFVKQQAAGLGLAFEKEGVDTLKIARKVLPQLASRSLAALCRYYHIRQEKAHRAMEDAWNTWQLFRCLQQEYGETHPEEFEPKKLTYRVKKQSPITNSQKLYLNDLIKYHRIVIDMKIDSLTKSEASRMIDHIILQYGKIKR
ncbi:MAG: PolC-type DNA polymerase III [Ruminococcus sp.]